MKRMDRSGQIILLSSFIIGIGIVVLTVMLNNIVYVSNTASESSIETNVFDYSNVVNANIEAYEKAYVDAKSGSNVDNDTFNAYLTNYSEKMVKSYSLSGYIYTLDTGSLQDPYFTENGFVDGNDDWTIIERVNSTESFLLGSLDAATLGYEWKKFVIKINNQSGSTIWEAKLFNSSGNINLTIYDGSSILYSKNDSISEINFTGNEIDGAHFELYFNNQTTGETYSIEIINGSQAMGTFLLEGDLVNGETYYIERIHVANSMVKLNKNGHLEINATIPITLPKGHT